VKVDVAGAELVPLLSVTVNVTVVDTAADV
jgi:hypothetical protein